MDNNTTGILFFLIIVSFFGLIVYATTIHNIESEIELFCDSGNFDTFIDFENVEYPHNNTLKIRNFDIKGIDNIKCRGVFKSKVPFYAYIKLLNN